MLRVFFFSTVIFLVSLSCTPKKINSLDSLSLIPYPLKIENTRGYLPISELTTISSTGAYSPLVLEMKSFWETFLMLPLETKTEGRLELKIDSGIEGQEAYQLQLTGEGVVLRAADEEGLYRAWQSLQQILVFSKKTGKIPTGTITDKSVYPFRGVMLDVARHFFTVSEVKRFIDLIALYKFNFLHLHLSDDQGWRIEIKSWPDLTAMSSDSEVGGTQGGFYTQEDYQELVAYAGDRFITIIPEIDIPGHTNAVLHAYPILNCDGVAPPVHTGIEVGFSSLCVEKPITYQFVEDVIRELAAITPGPYLHLGGDETQATPEDQFIDFVDKVLPMVNRYGKIPVGWFETRKTNYKGQVVSQYWAKEADDPEGVRKGNPILMSPSSFAYLDMKYDTLSKHGLFWAGYTSVQKAYDWSPKTLVPSLPVEDIIGIEAALWSETISDNKGIDYLAFPRILGHAEIGWTEDELRNWEEYKKRLQKHLVWLRSKGVAYYKSPLLLE
jgi:hexosaminidase